MHKYVLLTFAHTVLIDILFEALIASQQRNSGFQVSILKVHLMRFVRTAVSSPPLPLTIRLHDFPSFAAVVVLTAVLASESLYVVARSFLDPAIQLDGCFHSI